MPCKSENMSETETDHSDSRTGQVTQARSRGTNHTCRSETNPTWGLALCKAFPFWLWLQRRKLWHHVFWQLSLSSAAIYEARFGPQISCEKMQHRRLGPLTSGGVVLYRLTSQEKLTFLLVSASCLLQLFAVLPPPAPGPEWLCFARLMPHKTYIWEVDTLQTGRIGLNVLQSKKVRKNESSWYFAVLSSAPWHLWSFSAILHLLQSLGSQMSKRMLSPQWKVTLINLQGCPNSLICTHTYPPMGTQKRGSFYYMRFRGFSKINGWDMSMYHALIFL